MSKRILLIKPGNETPTEIIPTGKEWASTKYIAGLLGCKWIQKYDGRMRKIILSDGREIKFDLWVNEDGMVDSNNDNLLATLVSDPLYAARGGLRIVGNCIMEPYNETPLNEGDWRMIEEALWKDDKLLEKNCVANGINIWALNNKL